MLEQIKLSQSTLISLKKPSPEPTNPLKTSQKLTDKQEIKKVNLTKDEIKVGEKPKTPTTPATPSRPKVVLPPPSWSCRLF